MTPTDAAKLGIARTFQNIALFKGMSVLDNIMAGRNLRMHASFLEVALQLPRARREEAESREAVEEIIEFLEIEHIRKTPCRVCPTDCKSASNWAARSPPSRRYCCSTNPWPA